MDEENQETLKKAYPLRPIDIDEVLKILATNPKAQGHVSDGELQKILYDEKIKPEGLTAVLNKLERDLLVDTHINTNDIKRYAISIEGKMFSKNGGYAERERINKLNATNLEIDVRIRKRNEKLTARGAVFVAIGTMGLLLWEIAKVVYKYCHK